MGLLVLVMMTPMPQLVMRRSREEKEVVANTTAGQVVSSSARNYPKHNMKSTPIILIDLQILLRLAAIMETRNKTIHETPMSATTVNK